MINHATIPVPRWPVTLLLMLLYGCAPAEHDVADATLVFGGTILTMSDAQPEVEAMVIRGERIEALGARNDLEARFPSARRHDLQGRIARMQPFDHRLDGLYPV